MKGRSDGGHGGAADADAAFTDERNVGVQDILPGENLDWLSLVRRGGPREISARVPRPVRDWTARRRRSSDGRANHVPARRQTRQAIATEVVGNGVGESRRGDER